MPKSLEPKNWRQIYDHVKYMRSQVPAPVDTMGCERLPEKLGDPKVERFQLLIALMLSSQTKDEVNAQAMANLRNGLKGGLNLESMRSASEEEIDQMICKVGFHRRKAQYIKKTCEILVDKFEGDIPATIDEMISLPGVGPKMAHLLMPRAWGKVEGIGVDVHVHRLAQMWGWAPKSSQPENTRAALEKWLPKDLWTEINPMLVGFGQTICKSRGSKCGECLLAEEGLCKASKVKRTKKAKEIKEEEDLTNSKPKIEVKIE